MRCRRACGEGVEAEACKLATLQELGRWIAHAFSAEARLLR